MLERRMSEYWASRRPDKSPLGLAIGTGPAPRRATVAPPPLAASISSRSSWANLPWPCRASCAASWVATDRNRPSSPSILALQQRDDVAGGRHESGLGSGLTVREMNES